MTELTQLGNEQFNVPAILRRLDAEAKGAYGGSERTQIELVARLVRAQQVEITDMGSLLHGIASCAQLEACELCRELLEPYS